MLLINPPVVRVSEPPLGIARLGGFLDAAGLPFRLWDACLEGLLWLGSLPIDPGDTWGRRAVKNRERNLALLRSPRGYVNPDRYGRAVGDLQKVLELAVPESRGRIGLANYEDRRYSPLRRDDLIRAAQNYKDNPFYPWFRERIPEILAEYPAREAGISLNFLSQGVCAFALLGYLREEFPDLKILLGGGLVTSWMGQKLLDKGETFDGLVHCLMPGRGEEALADYYELSSKSPGIAEPAAPLFTGLDLTAYLSPGLILPFNFSWGCPYRRCTFCPEKTEGNPYLALSAQKGAEELQQLSQLHRPSLIHITDSEISPAHLRALAENPPGAPWYGFCRISPVLEDPAFCRALAASGCRMLQLGLESGDQMVLDALNKGIRVESSLGILKNLKEAGIGTYVYLLFGTPAEDLSAARRTLKFVSDNAGVIDFLNLAVFNLPAGSELAGTLDTAPFYPGDLSLYREFRHPLGWNRSDVRGFLSREFFADPEAGTIVRRNPRVFTSSHAPFFI